MPNQLYFDAESHRLNLGNTPLELRDRAASLNGEIRFPFGKTDEQLAALRAKRDEAISLHTRLYGYAPRIALA